MFPRIAAFALINIAFTAAFTLRNMVLSSDLKFHRSSSSALSAIWDLNLQRLGKGSRNLQGDDSEVPILPTPGGEVASKGTKKAYLKGPGVDERTSTIGSGLFSENDLDSLPRLYRFHRQLSLLSSLEGNKVGRTEKIEQLKMANLEGILTNDKISNTIRAPTVKDIKLLNDWNFDMNA